MVPIYIIVFRFNAGVPFTLIFYLKRPTTVIYFNAGLLYLVILQCRTFNRYSILRGLYCIHIPHTRFYIYFLFISCY